MATDTEVTFRLAYMAIFALMAAVFWTLPHRAAKFFAFSAGISVFSIFLQGFPMLGGAASSTWNSVTTGVAHIAILVGMWLYPERPQRKLEHAAFGLGIAWQLATMAILLVPAWNAWMNLSPAGVDGRTTAKWYLLSVYNSSDGMGAALFALLMILWLRRALAHRGSEAKAATFWVAAQGFFIWVFVGTKVLFAYAIATEGMHPAYHTFYSVMPQYSVAGDPFHLTAIPFLGAALLPVVFIAYASWKRLYLPLIWFGVALVAYALRYGLLGIETDIFEHTHLILTGILFLWALTRYNVFGAKPLPRWGSLTVAGGFGLAILFASFAFMLSFGDSPLLIGFGILVAMVLGFGSAAIVLRQVLGMQFRPAPDATSTFTRIEPYHTQLAQELAAGTSEDDAFAKLKPLRASLGISDHEHSILAYAAARRGGPATLAGTSLKPGARFLDRYAVQKTLRAGGAGVAHLCKDEKLNRLVVIKTLRADTAGKAALDELLREARAQGQVESPTVVHLYDADHVGDEVFLVMEYVEGGTLADRLKGKPLSAPMLRNLARDLLSALTAVHGSGLVHRDVKPSNVFLAKDGKAKLGDFGVAHLPGFEATQVAGPSHAIGTLRYMSPEQARGRPPRVPGDLWGAAVTLYEAATGKPYVPAKAKDTGFSLQARVAGLGEFSGGEPWTAKQGAFWKRALHPESAKRFQSASQMAKAFQTAWGPSTSKLTREAGG